MGWAVGFDTKWNRDVGYGVPSICDHPECCTGIDRGLGYVCGGAPYGGDEGCGLFFCLDHLSYVLIGDDELGGILDLCERCTEGASPFDPTPDTAEWMNWKLSDESWGQWRAENPEDVARLVEATAGE